MNVQLYCFILLNDVNTGWCAQWGSIQNHKFPLVFCKFILKMTYNPLNEHRLWLNLNLQILLVKYNSNWRLKCDEVPSPYSHQHIIRKKFAIDNLHGLIQTKHELRYLLCPSMRRLVANYSIRLQFKPQFKAEQPNDLALSLNKLDNGSFYTVVLSSWTSGSVPQPKPILEQNTILPKSKNTAL